MPSRCPRTFTTIMAALFILGVALVPGCSGPQPLSMAIRAADEEAYTQALREHGQSPSAAYFAWRSQETNLPVKEIEARDRMLKENSNPFSARSDPQAVSRGAVIYKLHCASCHGDDVDGRGPAMPVALDSLDFHSFSKRFAATLHGGAPRAWYRKISEGVVSETAGPDGKPLMMPPFSDELAREQIWLAITYLQSLDMNAEKEGERR